MQVWQQVSSDGVDCASTVCLRHKITLQLQLSFTEPATDLDGSDHVFVHILPDAVIKYGVFVGNKSYACDFL